MKRLLILSGKGGRKNYDSGSSDSFFSDEGDCGL